MPINYEGVLHSCVRFSGVESRGTGHEGDGLLASVREVVVNLLFCWVRAHAENAVFRLHEDGSAGLDELGGQHGHADAEVHCFVLKDEKGCSASMSWNAP